MGKLEAEKINEIFTYLNHMVSFRHVSNPHLILHKLIIKFLQTHDKL